MRSLWSLIKLQVNATLGLSGALRTMKSDKKALWKAIGIGAAMLLAVGQLVFFYSFLLVKIYQTAEQLNTPQLILTIGTLMAGVMILFLGVFFIISSLFLAKDNEFLASLPIPQGNIFVSKFCLVMLWEYPLAFFTMLPPVIIYGVNMGKGLLYYLTALITILLIPIVPLVVSSILSLGMMRIVSRSRRRDTLIIVGSIVLLVALFLGQNYFLARIPENDTGFMTRILQKSDGLVELSGRVYPPSIWVTRALSLTGTEALLNLLYFIGFTGLAFAVVYGIASFIYQKGATAQLETLKRPGNTKLTYEVTLPVWVMFKNEWRNLARTPIFALNSLVMIFVGPLIMGLPLMGGNFANDPDIQFLYNLIEKGESRPAIMLIVAGLLTFIALINPAITSTFSREGKCFWILKCIPVEPIKQVTGKLLAGYSISALTVVTTSIVIKFAFGFDFLVMALCVLLALLALIPICIAGLIVDLKNPKLVWNNPQEAIKQNMNVILGMLIGFLFMIAFGAVGFGLLQLELELAWMFIIVFIILSALSLASWSILKKIAKDPFKTLDV